MTEVPFVYQRRVRWGDGDPALIAYTVRFLDYVMEAIEEWYREYLEIDWYQLTVDKGMGAPVVHLEFDFSAPIKPGDVVSITLQVDEIRRSVLSFAFRGVREDGVLSFSGKLAAAFVAGDGEQIRAAPIPDDYRRRILAYQQACVMVCQ